MQGGLLDPGGLQGVGDLGQFVLGDDQVAHEHGLVLVLGEGRVAAERQAGVDGDALARDLEVLAGQRDAVDGALHQRSGAAKGVGDRLPVRLRGLDGLFKVLALGGGLRRDDTGTGGVVSRLVQLAEDLLLLARTDRRDTTPAGSTVPDLAIWRLPRSAWPDMPAVAVPSAASVYLWRPSANMTQLNRDGLPGFSANDWAASVLTSSSASTPTPATWQNHAATPRPGPWPHPRFTGAQRHHHLTRRAAEAVTSERPKTEGDIVAKSASHLAPPHRRWHRKCV